MAYRTWGKVLLAAFGVGLVAGAGQLGVGYGLGVVRFNRAFEAATVNQWPAQVVWVGWFALVAAVAGAVAAHPFTRRYDLPVTTGTRMLVAAAATVGALVVAPLSMRPARTAEVAGVGPVAVVGTAALLGALAGLVAAAATLHWRTVGRSVAVFVGFGWLLALVSVLPSLGPTDPLPAVRLGALDPSWLGYDAGQRVAVLLMPAAAVVVGALLGALARRDGLPMPLVATAGLVGPATFAAAYLLAGAGDQADGYQAAPYWGSLVSVAAGVVGSGLTAVVRWPGGAAEAADEAGPTSTLDTSDEPTTTRIVPADEPTARVIPAGKPTTAPAPADEPTITLTPADEPTTRITPVGNPTTTPAPADEPDSGPGVPGPRNPRRRGRPEQQLPASDEEYVDWVSGLGRPDPAAEQQDRGDGQRRRLRQPGRHHAD